MKWIVYLKHGIRLSKDRQTEPRLTAVLSCDGECEHPLPGEHGHKILSAAAEHFNAIKYAPTLKPMTRCRADASASTIKRWNNQMP
jgi:hypothetical protein